QASADPSADLMGYLVMTAAIRPVVQTKQVTFCQNSDGSVAMIFALAIIPIMIAAGAAVDYSRANSFKAVLQAALDSAILAGAKDGTSNWSQVAANAFQANMSVKSSLSLTPSFTLDDSGSYTGSVSTSVPTSLLAIMKIQFLNVIANSAAQASSPD